MYAVEVVVGLTTSVIPPTPKISIAQMRARSGGRRQASPVMSTTDAMDRIAKFYPGKAVAPVATYWAKNNTDDRATIYSIS